MSDTDARGQGPPATRTLFTAARNTQFANSNPLNQKTSWQKYYGCRKKNFEDELHSSFNSIAVPNCSTSGGTGADPAHLPPEHEIPKLSRRIRLKMQILTHACKWQKLFDMQNTSFFPLFRERNIHSSQTSILALSAYFSLQSVRASGAEELSTHPAATSEGLVP